MAKQKFRIQFYRFDTWNTQKWLQILLCWRFIFDNESSIKFNLEMQITVYVCYDRQVTGVLNLNVFQAPFCKS